MAFWNRWTLGLDFKPRNAGLWADRLPKNTQNLLHKCVFLGRNPGPESNISEPKMQVQGPVIPKCSVYYFMPILNISSPFVCKQDHM